MDEWKETGSSIVPRSGRGKGAYQTEVQGPDGTDRLVRAGKLAKRFQVKCPYNRNDMTYVLTGASIDTFTVKVSGIDGSYVVKSSARIVGSIYLDLSQAEKVRYALYMFVQSGDRHSKSRPANSIGSSRRCTLRLSVLLPRRRRNRRG